MKITIISVGKIKDQFYTDAIGHYSKQLNKKCQFTIIELPDEKAPENLSDKEMITIKQKEGERILSKINREQFVIALAIEGKMLSTEKFRKKMVQLRNNYREDVVFIIGGSLGLDEAVMKRSDDAISFSKMTFPHQLMRVVLVEQIIKII